jgi:hypothetical protein
MFGLTTVIRILYGDDSWQLTWHGIFKFQREDNALKFAKSSSLGDFFLNKKLSFGKYYREKR